MNCHRCLLAFREGEGILYKGPCFNLNPSVYCSKKCYDIGHPKREVVLTKTEIGENKYHPENVRALIGWLQAELLETPEECRDSLAYTTESDGDGGTQQYFSYERPYTPREEAEMAEQKRIREHARHQSELAQLKRLQKLYPNQK